MTALPEPPAALASAFDRWQSAKFAPQQPFSWKPESWRRRFERATALPTPGIDLTASVDTIAEMAQTKLNGRDDLINRETVTELHKFGDPTTGADSHHRQAVVTAFVAAMIWGYGTTGYGPYRTERVLTSDPQAVEHLVEVAELAQGSENGGIEAFEHIADARSSGPKHYLKYLGPAFGTKLLYFLTAASGTAKTTPVMDAVVRRWFKAEADISLRTGSWHTKSYKTYLSSLDSWAGELPARPDGEPLTPDDVELLIFTSQRGDSSAWDVADESLSVDQLLDLLQSDIDELAERSGSSEGPELLQRLSDWVAGIDSAQS